MIKGNSLFFFLKNNSHERRVYYAPDIILNILCVETHFLDFIIKIIACKHFFENYRRMHFYSTVSVTIIHSIIFMYIIYFLFFIYFIFGCTGSSLLCKGFLYCDEPDGESVGH